MTAPAARWLGLFLVLSLLLSACAAPAAAPTAGEGAAAETAAGEAAGSEAAATGEVSREETLIFAADLTDMITLDPAVAYEFGGILPVGNMYETLVSFNPGAPEIVGVLAEAWEITDAGDTWSMTFTLDPDAKFASGNPVTADDVVFSWNRAVDSNKSPAWLLIAIFVIYYGGDRVLFFMGTKQSLPDFPSLQVSWTYLPLPIGSLATLLFVIEAILFGSQHDRPIVKIGSHS